MAAAFAGTGAGVCAQAEPDAGAAGGDRAQGFRLRAAIEETLTDNVGLVESGRQSEAITELSTGVSLERQGGRVQGFLDYTLTRSLHARIPEDNETRHALNASGRAEMIDEFAYLDASAAITRQSISAFGTQSVDDALPNPNRTDVRTYRLSPWIGGRLGRLASYEARLTHSATDSSEGDAYDVSETEARFELAGGTVGGLGWAARAESLVTDYQLGRRTRTDGATGSLRLPLGPRLLLSATAGREWTDVLTGERRSSRRYGWGFDWRPTERTRLAAEREQRYYGRSHSIVFSHQRPRSVWTYADTRSAGTGSGFALGSRGTVFDLFYRQFEAVEPDPVRRTALVTSFLQANGLDANAPVLEGFLTSTLTLDRRQTLSAAFSGVRSTVVVSVAQSRTRQLDTTVGPGSDDLSDSGAIRQRGVSLTFSHRLTPSATLNLGLAQQNTRGEGDERSNRLRSHDATWTGRFGRRVTVSVGARHVRYESPSSPYRENAILARLSAEF